MQAGEIVWVKFPYEGQAADKRHPALVLDVLANNQAVVAYGSSQRVDRSNPPPNEVTVTDPADLEACGLRIPTRFDLGIRAQLTVSSRDRIGTLPQHKIKQFYRAAVYCGLLEA